MRRNSGQLFRARRTLFFIASFQPSSNISTLLANGTRLTRGSLVISGDPIDRISTRSLHMKKRMEWRKQDNTSRAWAASAFASRKKGHWKVKHPFLISLRKRSVFNWCVFIRSISPSNNRTPSDAFICYRRVASKPPWMLYARSRTLYTRSYWKWQLYKLTVHYTRAMWE